jgi:hypothetical protein
MRKQQNVYLCECVDELLFFREGQMIKAELCFFYKWHPTVRLKYLFFSIQMVDYAYQDFENKRKRCSIRSLYHFPNSLFNMLKVNLIVSRFYDFKMPQVIACYDFKAID